MKVGNRVIVHAGLIIGLLCISVLADGILKYQIIDNSTPLSLGTVVRMVGDMRIDACGSSDTPIGVIIGYEGPTSAPEYYLVANSGIARNVLCGSAVSAGDKVIAYNSGTVRGISADPMGFVVGTALEAATIGERIRIMINLEGAGGSASLWLTDPSGDFIFSADNYFARVYDYDDSDPYADTAIFHSENINGYGGMFMTNYYGLKTFAGVYGVANTLGASKNYGVLGKNLHSGNWGYLGGEVFGAQGNFSSGSRWAKGYLGGPDLGVFGQVYTQNNSGMAASFTVQSDGGAGEPTYGVFSHSYSDSSFGVYAVGEAYPGGYGYGLYATAQGSGRQVGIYGEISLNGGHNNPYREWAWIAAEGGATGRGGFVSTGGGDYIHYTKAAIYGENMGTDIPIAILGQALGSKGIALAGFGERFGVLGISTGSGTSRAGGAFHCNSWSGKGGAGRPEGIGVISSGGTAGTVAISEHLGIYSATTIDSEGGAAYFTGNTFVSNGLSVALIDTATSTKEALRVPAYDNVSLSAKIQTEGIARIQAGRGFVELPEAFLRSIKNGERPVIILTPYSADCKGLAVARFERNGFSVMELNGGTGDAEFAWTASATRRDFPENGGVHENLLRSDFDEAFMGELPGFSEDDGTRAIPVIENEY